MKTIRQLLRQPVRSLLGIALAALSVLLLAVAVGQYAAALQTRRVMERNYSTVALPTDAYMTSIIYDESGRANGVSYLSSQPAEIVELIDGLTENYPELVREVASHGLASAYAPGIDPINFTQYDADFNARVPNKNTPVPYSCAMLEIRVTKIGEPYVDPYGSLYLYPAELGVPEPLTVDIVGVVESVVALQEGFNDPTGFTIHISLRVADQAALDAARLEVGGRYLVYDTYYQDLDWSLRRQLSGFYPPGGDEPTAFEPSIDPQRLRELTPEEIAQEEEWNPDLDYLYEYLCPVGEDGCYPMRLSQFEYDMIAAVGLEVCDETIHPQDTRPIRDWFTDGDQLFYAGGTRLIRTDEGAVEIGLAEYRAMYATPTIAPLTGSVEDFLASEEGELWRTALEDMEVSNHALPVLGVDALGAVANFARQLARVTQGRDFTEEEHASGANVCVISETLAQANGLAVGDTVSLQYYDEDPNLTFLDQYLYGYFTRANNSPAPAFYSRAQGFSSQPEDYTIVGLYRQSDEWRSDDDPYAFTPNTVFVPKSSVRGEMHFADSGVYQTILLQNGAKEGFEQAMLEAGYGDLFVCYDRGYTEIAASLESFTEVSRNVLIGGVAAWAVVLLLFLALFPAGKRGDARRMVSLGATGGQARIHMFLSALGLLLPGTALGGAVGALLWERAAREVMAAANASLELSADPRAIPLAVLAALGTGAALSGLLTALLCRRRGAG